MFRGKKNNLAGSCTDITKFTGYDGLRCVGWAGASEWVISDTSLICAGCLQIQNNSKSVVPPIGTGYLGTVLNN
jgi:hypothetical protein